MPILEWLLRANDVSCAIQGQWAELRWLRRKPMGLVERLHSAMDLFPCELLFVHRDAEAAPYDFRQGEIRRAMAEAFGERRPAWVSVIPVRMREAWLLFDEVAIRRAAGNPSGRVTLRLPELSKCEDLPDPKSVLHETLRVASELSARRRSRLPLGPMTRRITEYIRDFTPLRRLPAFAALERELQKAITTNRWDHR